MMSIEMFPASYGDSFFVSCGTEHQTHILIDTGFTSTYNDYIRERLEVLHKDGGCLALLAITHIDADHISGALKLLEENGHSSSPSIINIDQIWHNSYRHLQWDQIDNDFELSRRGMKILDEIRAQGFPRELRNKENQEVPISAKHGSSLASLIFKGDYSWNSVFGGQAACVENQRAIRLSDDVSLTMLTPTLDRLTNLKSYWRKELYKLGYKIEMGQNEFFDDAFEFLVSRENQSAILQFEQRISHSIPNLESFAMSDFVEDTSVVNGSSMSFIIQCNNKKVLFLGDTHPSDVEWQLRNLYGDQPVWYDAVKISHHGSSGNTSSSLLQLIESPIYLISTNGVKYHHPDIETLARIVCRDINLKKRLIFNYETPASAYMNKEQWKVAYNYEVEIASNRLVIEI
jgi:hypothetical protein